MFAFADNDVDVAYFVSAAAAILPPTNLALLVRHRYAMYRILKIFYDIKNENVVFKTRSPNKKYRLD